MDLIEKAKALIENCKSRETCVGCPFNTYASECNIAFSHYRNEIAAKPKDWEL